MQLRRIAIQSLVIGFCMPIVAVGIVVICAMSDRLSNEVEEVAFKFACLVMNPGYYAVMALINGEFGKLDFAEPYSNMAWPLACLLNVAYWSLLAFIAQILLSIGKRS